MTKTSEIVRDISPAMARIHAHICGDGCVYLKQERRSEKELRRRHWSNPIEDVWVIEYTNTCRALLDEFNRDLRTAFRRKGQWRLRHHRVRVTSVKRILERLELLGKNSYNWQIPAFIKHSDPAVKAAWLRAFFDDEGTITRSGAVRIKSMNEEGLRQVKELVKSLDMACSFTGPNCDKSYYLYLFKRGTPRYAKIIGFNHTEKAKRLIKWLNEPAETSTPTPLSPAF